MYYYLILSNRILRLYNRLVNLWQRKLFTPYATDSIFASFEDELNLFHLQIPHYYWNIQVNSAVVFDVVADTVQKLYT